MSVKDEVGSLAAALELMCGNIYNDHPELREYNAGVLGWMLPDFHQNVRKPRTERLNRRHKLTEERKGAGSMTGCGRWRDGYDADPMFGEGPLSLSNS